MFTALFRDGRCAVSFARVTDYNDVGCLSKEEFSYFSSCKSEKRRQEFLAGRCVAKATLAKLIKVSSEVSILKDENGKPYFAPPYEQFCVSISHSHGIIAVLIYPIPLEYGIDLEFIDENHLPYLKKIFSESRNENIMQLTTLWCLKEAAYKIGIKENFVARHTSPSEKQTRELESIKNKLQEHTNSLFCTETYKISQQLAAIAFVSDKWTIAIAFRRSL